MNGDEIAAQERLNTDISKFLKSNGELDDRVLTGWIVCWETATLSDEERATAGHLYGPHGMTTWRALGLIEWARRFCLQPDNEDQ